MSSAHPGCRQTGRQEGSEEEEAGGGGGKGTHTMGREDKCNLSVPSCIP